MAADDLQTGNDKDVRFTPDGGTELVFPASDWTLSRNPNTVLMANARDGIKRKTSLRDGTGSVNGFYDSTVEPGNDLSDGDKGVIKLYVDDTRFYQLTVLLSQVDVNTGGQFDAMRVSFNFELESGTITEPI